MRNLIQKIKRLCRHIVPNLIVSKKTGVNWIKSWLFNYQQFGFRIAWTMPIFLYDVEFLRIPHFIIKAPLSRGLIKIGKPFIKSRCSTKIDGTKDIIFNGPCLIEGGTSIECFGLLEFGKNVALGPNCEIVCLHHILIDDYVRIGYETSLMDTDYHFVLNTATHMVKNNSGIIHIGGGSWIGSNCSVMKNTIVPRNSIVSRGSIINKDFANEDDCTLFGGVPAKPIKHGLRRIHNAHQEQKLKDYFKEYPQKDNISLSYIDENKLCFDNFWGSEYF